MKSALVVIAAVLAASGQSVYSGSSHSGGTATWGANMGSNGVICGPPNYNCAVTDNQTHLPTTTVTLGNGWSGHSGGGVGANIVAIDHSLVLPGTSGVRILRLTDGVNVGNFARTFSGGGHNVISSAQANGKRYVAFQSAGGGACMFEVDEAALTNAVEGQVCANCSRKLWCPGGASASYGGTQNETYQFGSVQFPRGSNAPAYSFYAVHQDAVGTSPKLRRYLIVVKSTGLPPDGSGSQTLAYEIDPSFPEYDPDNANCLNGALAAGGYTYGNDYISVDDQRLALQTSPQDSSPWAVAVRVDTNPPQCRAVNAQTMQISCGWNTPGCWKDLNYNADAQARFQRAINTATRDAAGNVTVSFSANHTFPVGIGATANVEGCGSAANIDVRGAPITAVTSSTLTYTSSVLNQGNTWPGLNCTFTFGRGMHNTDLDRSGTFAQIGYNTTGLTGAAAAYIQTWNLSTDDFDACPMGQDCSGHSAPGYQLQYLPGFGQTRTSGYRTLGNSVGSFVKCTDMGLSPPMQEHFSANVANVNNNQWLESSFNFPLSTPHGPYEGELYLHSCGDGKIRRFAHNYPAVVSLAGCLAGFRILPNAGQPEIQAVVNGTLSGTAMLTSPGHIYALTTRIYSAEVFRRQQTFHSAPHPAGNGYGGADVSADVRIALEVHDVDPTNPATAVAPSTVLYDSVIAGAPGFCSYVLVNAASLNCSIAFTRILQAVDAEVRSALPDGSYRTRLVGSLSDGAECKILSSPALEFFPKYAPASGEFIEARYRGFGRAVARVNNPQSIFQQAHGTDDGVRAAVREVQSPSPRTAADCENAALALLDSSASSLWSGEYAAWSEFLPGNASDILPGDRLDVNVPSRSSPFQAIVSEVQIVLQDLAGDHSMYKIIFEDNRAGALAFAFQHSNAVPPVNLTEMTVTEVGSKFLPALKSAELTAVTSTTITIDAGAAPPSGGGIEVRWSDAGWRAGNDRNLVGRFSTRSFSVPRLDRTQSYYLRQYDNSAPPKYSRYTTALHVDYPL